MNIRIQRRQHVNHSLADTAYPPLLQRIYATRGVTDSTQLDYRLTAMHSSRLKGVDEACRLLEQALRQQQFILIIGDFDADGATSTAVAIRALKAMGAAKVDYLVPNRFEFGYGLSPEIVDVAAKMKPDLIITVDNGIANIAGVEQARLHGIPVIITDHHLPGAQLPEAAAIVNPNLLDDDFPSKHLAGVGVIFYLMASLRTHLREQGWFEEKQIAQPNLPALLDLVALGTVADVVKLDHNNRILVEQGMLRIRAGKCIPGILALLQVGKRQYNRLVASDLGFAVGPRLNAAGRLEDISVGIECLLTDDPMRAEQLAHQLDQINHERRQIEQEMKVEAFAELDRIEASMGKKDIPAGICLYREDWHQGVVGILASRVKDKWHRPVIVFASEGQGMLKGSARSVAGLHIRDAFEAIATQNPGMIGKFGGHAMAAGLSLPLASLSAFKQAFADYVDRQMGDALGQNVIWSDGDLAADEMNLAMAESIRQAGPWGQGFPEPLFDGVFKLVDRRIVGQNHLKMVLQHPSGASFDAIAFNETGEWMNSHTRQVSIAYRLDVNEFRGQRSVQLMVEHVAPAPDKSPGSHGF